MDTFQRDFTRSAREFIRGSMADELLELIEMATYDLWHGPLSRGDYESLGYRAPWRGYQAALSAIRAWTEGHLPSELWWDCEAGLIQEAAPSEDDLRAGGFFHASSEEICRWVFGDLVDHGGL